MSSASDTNIIPDSKRRLSELSIKMDEFLDKNVLDVHAFRESIRDMEMQSSQPNFWDDQDKAQSLLTEMNRVKQIIERAEKWTRAREDVEMMLDLISESPDDAGIIIFTVILSKMYQYFIAIILFNHSYDQF
jgi:peptide chain release factor 2